MMDQDMYALTVIVLMMVSFVAGMAVGIFIEKGAP